MKQRANGGHWEEKEKARAKRPVDTADDGGIKVATTRPGRGASAQWSDASTGPCASAFSSPPHASPTNCDQLTNSGTL